MMSNHKTPAPRRLARRSVLIGGLATLLTAGGASAWALDEYVIDHVEVSNATEFEIESGSTPTRLNTQEAVSTKNMWRADGTTIRVRQVQTGSGSNTLTYFVADVKLTNAKVLRTGFANNAFGENLEDQTSNIAANNDAVFAVNGDYYGFRDTGIQIRNGTIYRDLPAREGIVFYKNGTAEIYDETQTSAQELLDAGAWNTLSFGPALVRDGSAIEGVDQVEIDTNFGNHSVQGDHPRTAVGLIDKNHLVFVVVDGREDGYSRGLSLPDLADVMVDLGAETAYNLDGGGSATMYFQGEVINRPSNGGERGVSDILYIGG